TVNCLILKRGSRQRLPRFRSANAPSGCFSASVFQDHVQGQVPEAAGIKQPPAFLNQGPLAVSDLNEPAIVELLRLGGYCEASIRFVDEVLNYGESFTLFQNPVCGRDRDLVCPADAQSLSTDP